MPLLPPKVHVPATPAIEGIDIRSLYDLDHATLLGKGGFSDVLAVRHQASNELRALKVMNRDILVGKKGEMVAHEKEILRRTCHPNIVTLYETIQNPDKVYFVLDLMNEDLFEFIVRNKRINEVLTRKIIFSILSAVLYLHEQSIVHRDIKPENILINVRYTGPTPEDMSGGEQQHGNSGTYTSSRANIFGDVKNINEINPDYLEVDVKLADFGLAKLVVEWDVRSTPCGTSFYIAPEVIRSIEEQGARPLVTTQQLVKSVDVWSAGVVFFVLLSGRPPFHGQVKTGEERRALLRKIDHGVLFNPNHGWDSVSEDAKDLILRMLEQDSAKRISAAECLRHPFFTKNGFPRPTPGGDPTRHLQRQQQQQLAILRQHQQQQQQRQSVREAGVDGGSAGKDRARDRAAGASDDEGERRAEMTFIVGEGCASVRAQMQQQQQQQNGEEAAGTTSAPGSSSRRSSASRTSKTKRNSIFSNVKFFFTGGSGSTHGNHDKGGGKLSAAAAAVEKEEQQQLHAELEALRRELLAAEDKEGEQTAYQPSAPIKEQKPARPAMMNANAKVGPAALKR